MNNKKASSNMQNNQNQNQSQNSQQNKASNCKHDHHCNKEERNTRSLH